MGSLPLGCSQCFSWPKTTTVSQRDDTANHIMYSHIMYCILLAHFDVCLCSVPCGMVWRHVQGTTMYYTRESLGCGEERGLVSSQA